MTLTSGTHMSSLHYLSKLKIPTFKSQTSIVSIKYTFFAFSYSKALLLRRQDHDRIIICTNFVGSASCISILFPEKMWPVFKHVRDFLSVQLICKFHEDLIYGQSPGQGQI